MKIYRRARTHVPGGFNFNFHFFFFMANDLFQLHQELKKKKNRKK